MATSFGADAAPLLIFSPSREVLAEASPDGRLQLWDTATSTLRQQLVRNSHLTVRATCVAWHDHVGGPTLLAVGCDNGSILVWDVARGELAHELKGHAQPVLDVLFESSSGGTGDTLYSSSADRQVCSWSATTGALLNSAKAGKVAVHRLALAPDGAHMLLGGSAMRLVRLRGWKRVSRLAGHAEPVQCVSFSPGGRYVLSSSGDRHLTLWSVSYSASAAADPQDQSVCSIALDAAVAQLGFHPSEDDSSLSFFALTADGRLGVWAVPASMLAPVKKPRKGKPAAAQRLAAQPDCLVTVATEDGQRAQTDSQRIFAAAFSAERELVAAYGSRARPHFARVSYTLPNGDFKPTVSLPRVGNGLLAAAADLGPDGKARAKRGRTEPPQQLGAMDMALPSGMSARQRVVAEDDNLPLLPAAATAALAAQQTEAAAAAAAEVAAAGESASFGERLAGMGGGGEEAVGPAKGPGDRQRKPTASSQVSLLVQALQNGDHVMLDQALQVQDAHVISATVARLPVTSVLPFMQAVLQRIQGKPARVATLASWLRALLSTHAAYLMSCSQLLPLLTPLYQLIDERLSVFKPLLKLVGRMQMLQAQMASQAAASRQDGAGASDPLFTYDEAAEAAAADEGEEEEEEFDEAESDGEDEGEDDDDDLSDLDGLDEDEDEEY